MCAGRYLQFIAAVRTVVPLYDHWASEDGYVIEKLKIYKMVDVLYTYTLAK